MDGISLTFREKRFLFALRFRKALKPKFDVSYLIRNRLVCYNDSGERNEIGEAIMEDTCSLTDFAVRYRIAKRQDFWKRVVTPITVSILTTIALNGLRLLMQWLSALRQ